MDAQTNSRQKSFVFNQFATKEQKHLKINNFSSKDKYPFRDQKNILEIQFYIQKLCSFYKRNIKPSY